MDDIFTSCSIYTYSFPLPHTAFFRSSHRIINSGLVYGQWNMVSPSNDCF